MLDLKFTGRTIEVPIVKQYLFIGPGRYRLRGEYAARQFRFEEGLSWAVHCTKGTAGMSQPLLDTLGEWHPFDFEFRVGPECGLVASLQLEPANGAAAALGARGSVTFDNFTLEKLAR